MTATATAAAPLRSGTIGGFAGKGDLVEPDDTRRGGCGQGRQRKCGNDGDERERSAGWHFDFLPGT